MTPHPAIHHPHIPPIVTITIITKVINIDLVPDPDVLGHLHHPPAMKVMIKPDERRRKRKLQERRRLQLV